MTRNPLAALLLSAIAAASTPAVANQKGHAAANPDALIQQDFQKRIDVYIGLRNDAVKGISPLKPTADPAEITAGQHTFAQRITAARSDAKPGDIFTPDISRRFRELLAPHLIGEDGRDARAIVKDDAPPAVPFKVNAAYQRVSRFLQCRRSSSSICRRCPKRWNTASSTNI